MDSAGRQLEVYDSYYYLYGRQEGNNCELIAENCRLRNGLFGVTSGVTLINGSVLAMVNLADVTSNTGNIYAGGTDASVGGKITLNIAGSATYLGTICGGSFADSLNPTISGGIDIDVSGISQVNNSKITSARTDLLIGGGIAINGKTLTVNGGITIDISDGASLGSVVGGGYALTSGTSATVNGDIDLTIKDASTRSIYGAVYAVVSGAAVSVVGNVSILIDATDAAVSISGGITASGYGNCTVTGDKVVTFTGLGSNLTFSSSVYGGGILRFDDYSGLFSGSAQMSKIAVSGDSEVEGATLISCNSFEFDITDRPFGLCDDVMLKGGFSFYPFETTVRVNLSLAEFAYLDRVELLEGDPGSFSDLTVELYNENNVLLATLDYDSGDTWTTGNKTFSAQVVDGNFGITCQRS
ncbi:MAG: hypothetical protein VB042_10125 [Victivallaceae bacterium]|nr:hypothetical protein [Victivallaceae bacterium]